MSREEVRVKERGEEKGGEQKGGCNAWERVRGEGRGGVEGEVKDGMGGWGGRLYRPWGCRVEGRGGKGGMRGGSEWGWMWVGWGRDVGG